MLSELQPSAQWWKNLKHSGSSKSSLTHQLLITFAQVNTQFGASCLSTCSTRWRSPPTFFFWLCVSSRLSSRFQSLLASRRICLLYALWFLSLWLRTSLKIWYARDLTLLRTIVWRIGKLVVMMLSGVRSGWGMLLWSGRTSNFQLISSLLRLQMETLLLLRLRT